MSPFFVLMVSLLSFISCAVGDDKVQDEFRNPPDASTNPKNTNKNPVYNAGDEVDFSWNTNADKVNVSIVHGSDAASVSTINTDVSDNSFKWIVIINGSDNSPNFDLMVDNMFFLQIFDSGADSNTAPLAQSVPFNITNSTVDAQGKKISSSSTTSSTQSSTSTTSSATTSTTATPTPTSSPPPKGMGIKTKAGIGIGIGMGAFAAIGSALFITYRLTHRNKQQHGVDPNPVEWARGEDVNIPMSANTATHAANAPLLSH